MRKHLYCNLKPCPACNNAIDLTDEVKQYILDNRVYRIEKREYVITLNQTINNYNQIMNFVNKMDIVEKITRFTEYNEQPLIGIEDHITSNFQQYIDGMECNKYIDFALNEKSLIETIDTLTHEQHVHNMNVVHDVASDRVKLFQSGEWISLMFDAGIDDLMSRVKGCYLDYYETYLLRRYIETPSLYKKQQMSERIQEYYKFIYCFDLEPILIGQSDGEVLGDDKYGMSRYDLEERFAPMHRKIKETTSHCEVTRVRKQVANIIKKNSKANVIELNMRMLELVQADDQFKALVTERLKCFDTKQKQDVKGYAGLGGAM